MYILTTKISPTKISTRSESSDGDCYIEEFRPSFHYVKGSKNVLADYLSRAPLLEEKESSSPRKNDNVEDKIDDEIGIPSRVGDDNTNPQPSTSSSIPATLFSSPDIIDCLKKTPEIVDCYLMSESDQTDCFMSARTPDSFLNVPPGPNPMDYTRIAQLQQNDNRLQQLRAQDPAQYTLQPFNNSQLICYRPPRQNLWKICVPDAMLNELITWYHNVLLHVGSTRLTSSISTHFYHPQLDERVSNFVKRCQDCQRFKRPGIGFGHLAPRECFFQPFTEVAVDMIGPWRVRVNNEMLVFKALTMIDTVSNLVELVNCTTGTGEEISRRFEHAWLYRYPRPLTMYS